MRQRLQLWPRGSAPGRQREQPGLGPCGPHSQPALRVLPGALPGVGASPPAALAAVMAELLAAAGFEAAARGVDDHACAAGRAALLLARAPGRGQVGQTAPTTGSARQSSGCWDSARRVCGRRGCASCFRITRVPA